MEFIPEDPILNFLPNTLESIRKIYDLDKGRMTQSVDLLEQWVKKQEHFVNISLSRGYLEHTIISCKGSVEKAKKQIDRLCTYKTLLPKYFVDGDFKTRFSSLNEIAYIIPLPNMTKDFHRLYFVKIIDGFTTEHFLDYYRLVIATTEYLREHDCTNGFMVVYDFRDANLLELMTKLNLEDCQHFISIMIKGFGSRINGIHILSQSKAIDAFVKLLKSVLSEKLGKRIQMHQSLEDLMKVIDKEVLPAELGGNQKPMKEIQEAWMNVLCSTETQKYLTRMKASKTDESLRKSDKFNEECMGLPGSFRTLTVD